MQQTRARATKAAPPKTRKKSWARTGAAYAARALSPMGSLRYLYFVASSISTTTVRMRIGGTAANATREESTIEEFSLRGVRDKTRSPKTVRDAELVKYAEECHWCLDQLVKGHWKEEAGGYTYLDSGAHRDVLVIRRRSCKWPWWHAKDIKNVGGGELPAPIGSLRSEVCKCAKECHWFGQLVNQGKVLSTPTRASGGPGGSLVIVGLCVSSLQLGPSPYLCAKACAKLVPRRIVLLFENVYIDGGATSVYKLAPNLHETCARLAPPSPGCSQGLVTRQLACRPLPPWTCQTRIPESNVLRMQTKHRSSSPTSPPHVRKQCMHMRSLPRECSY
jgi:hypothetical protein